jgi:hypothetical protein
LHVENYVNSSLIKAKIYSNSIQKIVDAKIENGMISFSFPEFRDIPLLYPIIFKIDISFNDGFEFIQTKKSINVLETRKKFQHLNHSKSNCENLSKFHSFTSKN